MVLPTQESGSVIVVQGNDDQVYTCITSAARPFRSHCWIRAAWHILQMKGFLYFTDRMEAYNTCYRVAEAVSAKAKAPQRVEPVKGFSWDSFKTITPIK